GDIAAVDTIAQCHHLDSVSGASFRYSFHHNGGTLFLAGVSQEASALRRCRRFQQQTPATDAAWPPPRRCRRLQQQTPAPDAAWPPPRRCRRLQQQTPGPRRSLAATPPPHRRSLAATPLSRRLQELLSQEELGGEKPTDLLRRMKKLLGDKYPSFDKELFLQLFYQRLPPDTQRCLFTVKNKLSVDELATLADEFMATLPQATDRLGHQRCVETLSLLPRPLCILHTGTPEYWALRPHWDCSLIDTPAAQGWELLPVAPRRSREPPSEPRHLAGLVRGTKVNPLGLLLGGPTSGVLIGSDQSGAIGHQEVPLGQLHCASRRLLVGGSLR
ncbi:hypothetical protein O3P69_007839, partial [Scylla paramamosain]